MRDRYKYKVQILEKDYIGDADALYPTSDFITITYGAMDDNELVVFKSSEARLSLLCKEANDPYMSLFTTDPMQYILQIYREVSPGNSICEWAGYLAAGTYTQDYANPPYRISLRATDGIALLKNMEYLDAEGKKYEGVSTVDDIIRSILSRISSMRVKYNIHDNIVLPEQGMSSAYHIAIDAKSIYAAVGAEKTPSCYDVLENILATLQLQLFQSKSAWHVRSVASLTTRDEDVLPIYSDTVDGEGMSVAATMSLCAPYRKLKVERPELVNEEYASDAEQLLKPWMWRRAFNGVQLHTKAFNDRLRLKSSVAKKKAHKDMGAAFVCSTVFSPSKFMSLTVGFDAYNINTSDKTVRVGLIAYASGADLDKYFLSQADDTAFEVNLPLWYWNVSTSKWVKLSGYYRWDTGYGDWAYPLGNMWVTETLEAAKKDVAFEIPTPADQLVRREISITADNLEIDTKYSLRFALLVVGGADESSLPPIELRNPIMSLKSTVDIVGDVDFGEARICEAGLSDQTYVQTFVDSWVAPRPGLTYEAPLLVADSGTALHGLVVPLLRPLLADAAVANTRLLRSSTIRQLDGEVYVQNKHVDLNTKWCDRDGRRYYTNYISKNFKRGLCSVQLRELSAPVDQLIVGTTGLSNPVALDTCVYMIRDNEDIVRIDLSTGKCTLVESVKYDRGALTLRAGQRCACVISDAQWNDGGKGYSLTAYDTDGNVLSYIEDITDLFVDSSFVDRLARSAVFDANVNTWVLIASTGSKLNTRIMIVSAAGELIATTEYTETMRLGPVEATLIPNGFVYRTNSSSWWHSNSEHVDAVVEALFDINHIKAVNEHFIATTNRVLWRTDLRFGYDATPLVEFNEHEYEFVGMNNALVVYRYSTPSVSGDLHVYDARTGRIITIEVPADSIYWLSADTIYFATQPLGDRNTYIKARRIMIGDGVGYATYITSDDTTYTTLEGKTYLTTK
jgi:hypothetical protein